MLTTVLHNTIIYAKKVNLQIYPDKYLTMGVLEYDLTDTDRLNSTKLRFRENIVWLSDHLFNV